MQYSTSQDREFMFPFPVFVSKFLPKFSRSVRQLCQDVSQDLCSDYILGITAHARPSKDSNVRCSKVFSESLHETLAGKQDIGKITVGNIINFLKKIKFKLFSYVVKTQKSTACFHCAPIIVRPRKTSTHASAFYQTK